MATVRGHARPPVHVYQLKAWIQGISPMVWLRLLIRSDRTLTDLHATLQIAIGWSETHLNRFHLHGKNYGVYYSGGISFADDPELTVSPSCLQRPYTRRP